MSRCDLHIHSRHSARTEEWLFRRFDFPDSYSDPKQLYEQLRKRGMDYVTITDHDSIDGCLEIAHLPRIFISEQVTTYFPHDACKLHILVWGISEQQHRDIESVRENIFDLQRYLQRGQIAHAVAHPLYSVNGKLEAMHLEQLILLFKHFEGINGLRDALLSDLAHRVRAEEIGCESYVVTRAMGSSEHFVIHARFSDWASFEGHPDTPHFKRFMPRLNALLASPVAMEIYVEA